MDGTVHLASMESFCWFISQSSCAHPTYHPENRMIVSTQWLTYIWEIQLEIVWNLQAIALLAGLCFHGVLGTKDQKTIQNIQGALFILTTENTFPALYGALGIFPMEWPLFLRDARGGLYSPSAYYLSKVVALVCHLTYFFFLLLKKEMANMCLISLFDADSRVCYWNFRFRFDCLLANGAETRSWCFSIFLLDSDGYLQYCCCMWLVLGIHVFHLFLLLLILEYLRFLNHLGTFFSAACESIAVAISFLIPFDYILFITGGVLISLRYYNCI